MDIREQLTALRNEIAQIDQKYSSGSRTASRAERLQSREFVDEVLSGEVVHTSFGSHFETERLYGGHKRHGSYDISDLIDLPHDFLAAVSDGGITQAYPSSWAFLDTETAGLLGGSRAYAFLIGVGSVDKHGFRLRQFFLRNYSEEASALSLLSAYLERFDVLITYNGRTFDAPLLESRYRLRGIPNPLSRMKHFDLLHAARRLFKLRLEDCRLVNLESEILGVEREGDLPGELIPWCYAEFLRTQHAFRLIPIFHHNAIDIISLACLTGIVAEAFHDPENTPARHGSDVLGLARWLKLTGRLEESHRLMRRAIGLGLPDRELFRALYETAVMEKKLGLAEASLRSFTELSLSQNPFRARACEAMAMHFEHIERNFMRALECVRAAREVSDSQTLAARQLRLEMRISRARRGKAGPRPRPRK